MSLITRSCRQVRRNHTGKRQDFKAVAKWMKRRRRQRDRQILRAMRKGLIDPGADPFPRHYRHTAAFEAY